MGLLGQIIGGALASRAASGRSSPIASALMALLAMRAGGSGALMGGLGGLIERFRQNGHGDTINSWIGSGPNRPIEPRQLGEAIGPDNVRELERRTGMPQNDLLTQLSQLLPGIVDRLTPGGRLPRNEDLVDEDGDGIDDRLQQPPRREPPRSF
jgi:uncharacterized protein YidB (DUF937 family)